MASAPAATYITATGQAAERASRVRNLKGFGALLAFVMTRDWARNPELLSEPYGPSSSRLSGPLSLHGVMVDDHHAVHRCLVGAGHQGALNRNPHSSPVFARAKRGAGNLVLRSSDEAGKLGASL